MDVNLYCLTNIHGSPEIARRCKRVKERWLMQEIFDIPLSLDIGTFLGLVAVGARRSHDAESDEVGGGRGQAGASRQAPRRRAQATVEKYRTHKEALGSTAP